jgi:MFS family permease
MVSAGLASRFSPTVGVRPVAIVGLVISAIGMLLLTRVPAEGSYPVDMLPALIITSLGMGAVFVPLTLIATTGLRNEDQGLASGLFNTSQQLGGALGLAILSTISASQAESFGGSHEEALVHGFHWAFAGAAAFVVAGLVLLLVLLRKEHVAQISAEGAPVPIA